MKVALVQAPASGVATPPLALASLAAYLRREGHTVLALDLNIELRLRSSEKYANAWDRERFETFWTDQATVDEFIKDNKAYLADQADAIYASGARIVGFSVYFPSLYVSLYLAGLLKKKDRKILIVFGGPAVSRELYGETALRSGNVDFAVQGEGEAALAEIVRNNKAGFACKGVLTVRNGRILDGGERELIQDLDSLPVPDFSDYKLDRYKGAFRLPIASTRGCCNKCVYCLERPYWRRFRLRSARSVYAELRCQLKRNPGENRFIFADSLINGSVGELEKLCGLIIKGGLKLRWSGLAVIRKEMTYEVFRKLRRAGCAALSFGLETPSVPLQLKAGKLLAAGADPEKILRDCRRAGIGSIVNFMFGLPGETEKDFRDTLAFVKRNYRHIGVINPIAAFCEFPSGTYGHAHPGELGIDIGQGQQYWRSADGSNNYLVRLRRFETFSKLASGLKTGNFYPSPRLLNRNLLFGEYYLHAGKKKKAAEYFARSLKSDSLDISAIHRLAARFKDSGRPDLHARCAREIEAWKNGAPARETPRLGEFSFDAFLKPAARKRPGRRG